MRQAGGQINKANGRQIAVNERKHERFKHKYGMSHREWALQKREWRAKGEGYRIMDMYRKSLLMQNRQVLYKKI